MKVLKFGGKCIATTDNFKMVAELAGKKGKNIIIVPAIPAITFKLEDISAYLYKKNTESAYDIINSLKKELLAFAGIIYTTSQTKEKAREYIEETTEYIRSFAENLFTVFEERIILAQGELISCFLFYLLLTERNINVVQLPALEFMRIDKNREADTIYIKEKLINLLEKQPADLYITQGYICRNAYGETDDFRQGGNDFTASLIGAAIKAEEIQIWTDTEGIYRNDSYLTKKQIISTLSFDEAAEMAYFAEKILHPNSILPARLSNIPVRIMSILNPESEGTLISENAEKGIIKAVAVKEGITAIRIHTPRMLLAHGFLRKVFEIFENNQTPIDMLASSEIGISVTIDNPRKLDYVLDELKKHGKVTVFPDMAMICIIGDFVTENARNRVKIAKALQDLPIQMISYGGSDYNFSFLINQEDKNQSLRILNDNLFLNN